jgi:hypothetical protein
MAPGEMALYAAISGVSEARIGQPTAIRVDSDPDADLCGSKAHTARSADIKRERYSSSGKYPVTVRRSATPFLWVTLINS